MLLTDLVPVHRHERAILHDFGSKVTSALRPLCNVPIVMQHRDSWLEGLTLSTILAAANCTLEAAV